MTRKLVQHLTENHKHWNVTISEDGLISVECSQCKITPNAIKEAVHGFISTYGLSRLEDEDCPIAGIVLTSEEYPPTLLQATMYNRAYATIRVAVT